MVTLHYGDGSGQYVLPVHLAAQASSTIDLGMLIQMGQPDANGNLIPSYIQEGSAVVSNSKGRAEWMTVAVNDSVQLNAKATYADGTVHEFTTSSTWSSGNTGVATVEASTGLVAAVSAGSVQLLVDFPLLTSTTEQICGVVGGLSCPTVVYCVPPSASTVCDFTIKPQTVRSCDCTNGTEQSVIFQANVSPSLTVCNLVASSSNGYVSASGDVEIDYNKTSCSFSTYPQCTVYYFSGPKRSDGTAGTITFEMSLQLGTSTVSHTIEPTVTCP